MKEHLRERRLRRKLSDRWREIETAEIEELMRPSGLTEKEVRLIRKNALEELLRRAALELWKRQTLWEPGLKLDELREFLAK